METKNEVSLIEKIKGDIIHSISDIYSDNGWDSLMQLLSVYNIYQEAECDGVDYIFNIDNQDDLLCCVKGGLTSQEVCGIYLRSQSSHREFFFFGQNYKEPKQIQTIEELKNILVNSLDDLLPYVIKYPTMYGNIYREYVSENILSNN